MSQNSLTDLVERVIDQSNNIALVAENIHKVYDIIKNASVLKKMVEFVNTLQTNNPKQIQDFFSSLPKTCKNMLSEKTQRNLSNQAFYDCFDDKQKEAIHNEIMQCQNKLLKTILYKEILITVVILGSQLNSMKNLANELEQADNLIKTSKEKINDIKKSLENATNEQIIISQTLATMDKTNIDSKKITNLASDIGDLLDTLSEIRETIQNFKIKVDGKIDSLNTESNLATRDAIVNSTQVLGNVIEFAMAGKMFSGGLIAVKCITTTLFATFGAIKTRQYYLTKTRIKELSKILNEVKILETEAKVIRKIIKDAKELVRKFQNSS